MNEWWSLPGYFARVAAIELLIARFVAACATAGASVAAAGAAADGAGAGAGGEVTGYAEARATSRCGPCRRQIVSLGAGLDTTYFKLKVGCWGGGGGCVFTGARPGWWRQSDERV